MFNSRDLGEIQLFRKFQIVADGGPRRKTEKFWQIEKKNRWSLRIRQFQAKNFFRKKMFGIKISNVIFWSILNEGENIFWSIDQI